MEKKLDVVAHACHSSNSRMRKIVGSLSRPAWAKMTPNLQNYQSKKG
jgi:hypothetical protein